MGQTMLITVLTRIRALVRAVDLAVSCGSAAALICLTAGGVVMRYFVGAPLIWLEEVQMILIVWLVMFGGSAAFREHAHVAIDVLVDRLPPGLRRRLNVVIALVVLAVLGVLVWIGIAFAGFHFRSQHVTSVLHIPYGVVYLAVPIGALLMMFSYICVGLLPPCTPARQENKQENTPCPPF